MSAGLAVLAVLALSHTPASGAVDKSFGQGGTTILDLGPRWQSATFSDLRPEPDGGVIATLGPGLVNSTVPTEVRRYRGDGGRDPGFASPIPPQSGAHVYLSDGGVLSAEPFGNGSRLVRLGPDGNPDPSFNGGASEEVPFSITAIAVAASGQIVVAGYVERGLPGKGAGVVIDIFAARFQSDGALDPAFGAGGVSDLRATNGLTGYPFGVHIAPGARIFLRIGSGTANDPDDRIVALTGMGALDGGWAGGGQVDPGGAVVALHPTGEDGALAIVNRKGARLGRHAVGSQIALLRYRPDGALDPAYGSGGVAILDLGGIDAASGALWEGDESVLVSAVTSPATFVCREFATCTATPMLVRVNPGGSPAQQFGEGGVLRLHSLAGPASATGIGEATARADGGFLVGGSMSTGAFIAAVEAKGALDAGFGAAGIVAEEFQAPSSSIVRDVAAYRGGGIIVGGSSDFGPAQVGAPPGILTLLDRRGRIDRRFGDGRGWLRLPYEVEAIDLDRGGALKVLIGKDAIARVTGGGHLDPAYGSEGFVVVPGRGDLTALAALRNGATLVASEGRSAGWRMGLRRIGRRGGVDRSFGNRGIAHLGIRRGDECTASGIAVQRDRRIVVVGECRWLSRGKGSSWRKQIAVWRLRPGGRLDRSFGNRGRARLRVGRNSSASSVTVQGRKILVFGSRERAGTAQKLLLRLNQNGRRDRRFGRGGIARVRIGSVARGTFCGQPEEMTSIYLSRRRILVVRDGTGPPLLAFTRNGRRLGGYARGTGIAPGRDPSPSCAPGPVGTMQQGRPLLAWTLRFASPSPLSIAVQRLAAPRSAD